MLLLTTTNDILRVITDSTATVDCHASWVDLSGTTVTPGSTNTAISSATTTTVVAAPGSGVRNVKQLRVRNRHASTSVTVTIQLYNGSTAYELEKRVLGAGQSVVLYEDGTVAAPPSGGTALRPWYGYVAGACVADGHPGAQLLHMQRAGNVAATPTNIAATVARCSLFQLPFDLTVNRLRAYGVGATTSVYRVAIYQLSNLARLTAELAFSTAAGAWVSIGSTLNLALTKDTPYFVAVSVNTTGTTPGCGCIGGTVAATTGQVAIAPGSLPGSLAIGATARIDQYYFQFAVTAGALPNPAATLAAQAAWTGGMPAIWLDNSDT